MCGNLFDGRIVTNVTASRQDFALGGVQTGGCKNELFNEEVPNIYD